MDDFADVLQSMSVHSPLLAEALEELLRWIFQLLFHLFGGPVKPASGWVKPTDA